MSVESLKKHRQLSGAVALPVPAVVRADVLPGQDLRGRWIQVHVTMQKLFVLAANVIITEQLDVPARFGITEVNKTCSK